MHNQPDNGCCSRLFAQHILHAEILNKPQRSAAGRSEETAQTSICDIGLSIDILWAQGPSTEVPHTLALKANTAATGEYTPSEGKAQPITDNTTLEELSSWTPRWFHNSLCHSMIPTAWLLLLYRHFHSRSALLRTLLQTITMIISIKTDGRRVNNSIKIHNL